MQGKEYFDVGQENTREEQIYCSYPLYVSETRPFPNPCHQSMKRSIIVHPL